MFRILTVAILGLFLLPHSLFGQESPSPHPIRVHLSVNGPDVLGVSLRANVAGELEAQGNVAVTEVDPHWILQIAALEMECRPGKKRVVVLSVLILETFSDAPLRVFLSDRLDTPTITAIGRLTSGLFRYSRHWIETGPADDVQGLAKGIVSRLHSVVLQSH